MGASGVSVVVGESGKIPQTVAPEPLVFRRAGVAGVDGRRLALYDGWVPALDNKRVLFRLPGQRQPQAIALTTGETRVEVDNP
jgi:hypothetical protein